MAKLVSVKREMAPTAQQRQDQTTQAPVSPAVTALGAALVAFMVCCAVAMVVMAFNFKPA